MNTDLITKLAKLANNNPNENEANAAARKVCRLLAEGNFEFGIQRTTEPDFKSSRPHPGNPFDTADMYEILRNMAYGFDRGYRRPPRYPGGNPFREGSWDTGQWEGFGAKPPQTPEEQAEQNKQREEYNARKRQEENDRRSRQDNRHRRRGFDFNEPKKPMKCKKCGKTVMTAFIGLPELFTCLTCQWNQG